MVYARPGNRWMYGGRAPAAHGRRRICDMGGLPINPATQRTTGGSEKCHANDPICQRIEGPQATPKTICGQRFHAGLVEARRTTVNGRANYVKICCARGRHQW